MLRNDITRKEPFVVHDGIMNASLGLLSNFFGGSSFVTHDEFSIRCEKKCAGSGMRLCQIKNGVKQKLLSTLKFQCLSRRNQRDDSSGERTTDRETEDRKIRQVLLPGTYNNAFVNRIKSIIGRTREYRKGEKEEREMFR